MVDHVFKHRDCVPPTASRLPSGLTQLFPARFCGCDASRWTRVVPEGLWGHVFASGWFLSRRHPVQILAAHTYHRGYAERENREVFLSVVLYRCMLFRHTRLYTLPPAFAYRQRLRSSPERAKPTHLFRKRKIPPHLALLFGYTRLFSKFDNVHMNTAMIHSIAVQKRGWQQQRTGRQGTWGPFSRQVMVLAYFRKVRGSYHLYRYRKKICQPLDS